MGLLFSSLNQNFNKHKVWQAGLDERERHMDTIAHLQKILYQRTKMSPLIKTMVKMFAGICDFLFHWIPTLCIFGYVTIYGLWKQNYQHKLNYI